MTQIDPEFESLLEYVRDARGFDYTGYKRPTLMRRFQKRLDGVGAESYGAYREHLAGDPDEFARLFDTILINVTGFFRDRSAWDYVAEEIVPRIVDGRERGATIRIWSAGCSNGAEAYTIAMLFAEAMPEDEFRERLKIYATDADGDALTRARQAEYTPKEVSEVPDELRDRYLFPVDGHFSLRSDIRRAVVFGRNDLLQDPPISRVDLLVSRNTIMYFGPEAQDRILSNFYFALRPRGYLMLGKAEALHSRTSLFEPLDLKRRLFVKNNGFYTEPRVVRRMVAAEPPVYESEAGSRLREAAFEHAPLAEVVVDLDGDVFAINHAARAMFGLNTTDVGRPFQDLELSYRPLELRSLIDEVAKGRQPMITKDVPWSSGGEEGDRRFLDIQISPLVGHSGERSGVVVSFADITAYRTLQDDFDSARRALETAYRELQSTVEELETTNEELQSTNEELEMTNEELQSTNEELEMMNEELQSTNEELEAMNDEMRERTDEAVAANSFLTSILSSVHQSVIVVDESLRIGAWSRAAAEAWGLREDDVRGEHLFNLDIGIPTDRLRDPIRDVLAGDEHEDVVLEGHDRRGRRVACTISFAQLMGAGGRVAGVILLMVLELLERDGR
jgi:two-component system CheB/CheR fusion protein